MFSFRYQTLKLQTYVSNCTFNTPFRICYKSAVRSVICGHHIYKEFWNAANCSAIGEVLEAAADKREEAKDYDKYSVGVYKKNILVGHLPVEISSLCFHFINQDPENKIQAEITGKRHREIGLVVPAKLVFLTDTKIHRVVGK